MRETALRPAADQSRAQGGLPLLIQCHERFVTDIRQRTPAERIVKNVDHLQAEPPALGWMKNRTQTPSSRDQTMLEGGARLGRFWLACKNRKRCTKVPYNLLLTNRVLKTDFNLMSGMRGQYPVARR